MKLLITEPPAWLRTLPKNAGISAKEFSDILGYKGTDGFSSAVSHGIAPECDYYNKLRGRRHRPYWYPATVIKEIKRRLALQNNPCN